MAWHASERVFRHLHAYFFCTGKRICRGHYRVAPTALVASTARNLNRRTETEPLQLPIGVSRVAAPFLFNRHTRTLLHLGCNPSSHTRTMHAKFSWRRSLGLRSCLICCRGLVSDVKTCFDFGTASAPRFNSVRISISLYCPLVDSPSRCRLRRISCKESHYAQ
jgi:hypothetical protein